MKPCTFIPFNILYRSFLPHSSLFPSITQFYYFQNFRRYSFYMCYSKFCKSVSILQYDRSIRSHMLKTGRNPSQDIEETPKPAKQSKPFSLKRERSQKMTCSSHWNNPIPKKRQIIFFPNLNTDNSTSTPTALLNRWGEKKQKRKKPHHKKSQKDSLLLFKIPKPSAQLSKITSIAHFHTEQKSENFAPELFMGKNKRCHLHSQKT